VKPCRIHDAVRARPRAPGTRRQPPRPWIRRSTAQRTRQRASHRRSRSRPHRLAPRAPPRASSPAISATILVEPGGLCERAAVQDRRRDGDTDADWEAPLKIYREADTGRSCSLIAPGVRPISRGMTRGGNERPNNKEAMRRGEARPRMVGIPPKRPPEPTQKPKERPASKGRVHKGRTRN